MNSNKHDGLSYEQAVSELEKIIQKLENGQVGLEESLRLYTEGVSLSKKCAEQLAAAENQLRILTQNEKGDMLESNLEEIIENGR